MKRTKDRAWECWKWIEGRRSSSGVGVAFIEVESSGGACARALPDPGVAKPGGADTTTQIIFINLFIKKIILIN